MLSKKQHSTNHSIFPISTNEWEIYVMVNKIFGGGIFEVMDQNKKIYKAYLRGKMKGSNKRHNLVSIDSILLVGIRPDFSDKSIVDILFVYDNIQIQILSLNSDFPIYLFHKHHLNLNTFQSNDLFQFNNTDHHDNIHLNQMNNMTHNMTDNNTHTDTDTDTDIQHSIDLSLI